jgi:hypothetical protein
MNEIATQIPYKEILLSIMTFLSAFLLWRIQYQKDRVKNIESQLSERKYKMYSEFVYILFDITNATKTGKPVTEKEIIKRMAEIKRDMFIYAPDKVFKKFTEWTLKLSGGGSGITHFKTYFELMKMIREDMGNKGTKLKLDDFMLFYMQSEQEYEKFKETHF